MDNLTSEIIEFLKIERYNRKSASQMKYPTYKAQQRRRYEINKLEKWIKYLANGDDPIMTQALPIHNVEYDVCQHPIKEPKTCDIKENIDCDECMHYFRKIEE